MLRSSRIVATAAAIVCIVPLTARAELVETRLTTGAPIESWNFTDQGLLGFEAFGFMEATLTDADGGPLAGRTITFEGSSTCADVTDESGTASCGQASGGYTATFAGDEVYAGSVASSCLATATGSINGCVFGDGYLANVWVN